MQQRGDLRVDPAQLRTVVNQDASCQRWTFPGRGHVSCGASQLVGWARRELWRQPIQLRLVEIDPREVRQMGYLVARSVRHQHHTSRFTRGLSENASSHPPALGALPSRSIQLPRATRSACLSVTRWSASFRTVDR